MNYSLLLTELLKGLLISAQIFLLTLVFSLPLGLVIALARMSKFSPLRWLATLIISILRGTPLMLQLLVVYFGPYYIFRVPLFPAYRHIAVIIAFAVNYAAYFAEIYRAGIESIPKGQYEAAEVLGYSHRQTFVRIIMPQVVKRILPPVTNEVITLVKDTSLAFAISIYEMFTTAKEYASSSSSMIPFVIAGVLYYIFNFVVAYMMQWAEKRLDYYR